MATFEWIARLILIVHIDANTADNRTAFTESFVNNGSGESLEDERKMFRSARKLALASSPTVHRAFGISTLAKASMRDALLQVIADIDATLTPAKRTVYYGVSNVSDLNYQSNTYQRGQCFFASRAEDQDFVGEALTPAMILNRLNLVVFDDEQ